MNFRILTLLAAAGACFADGQLPNLIGETAVLGKLCQQSFGLAFEQRAESQIGFDHR